MMPFAVTAAALAIAGRGVMMVARAAAATPKVATGMRLDPCPGAGATLSAALALVATERLNCAGRMEPPARYKAAGMVASRSL